MRFNIKDFHQRNRTRIVQEWAQRLNQMYQYSRPYNELLETCAEAFDANYQAIVNENYGPIDQFINKITKMRLEAGFLLSDVQKAFELYRSIVIPLLAQEILTREFVESVEKINKCLAYTIHRFSDHFQNMHEKEILEQNKNLEELVKSRTIELQESEQKYRTLVEEIIDGYFVVQDEKIVFANKAFCDMHNYTLDEVLGSYYCCYIAPEDKNKVSEIFDKSLEKDATPKSFEYFRLTKTGEQYPTEILARATLYENHLSLIGICRDITERVHMEKKVRESERMAYIGQITTSLSHELRNPLSSVKMNLQILRKNPDIKANDARRIDISIREVDHLEHTLKQFLDLAKPIQLKLTQVDINQTLLACIEFLDMKFKEKDIRVYKKLKEDMPFITVDQEKIEQAIINLLLNAIEASHNHGSIFITTRTKSENENTWFVINIQDKGPGIPDETLDELFKPFFTTKSQGTGLGLSNVKRTIESHGGKVEVVSSYLAGTTFSIYLSLE